MIAVLVLAGARTWAADWTGPAGTPGDWFDPLNWFLNCPPNAILDGTIRNGGIAEIASGDAVAKNLLLGGTGGTGSVIESGGTMTTVESLTLGGLGGNTGSYTLTGTGELVTAYTTVGYKGSGTFVQDGGRHTTETLHIGSYNSYSGTYSLGGTGELYTTDTGIGGTGIAHFTQTGGRHVVADTLGISRSSSSAGGLYELLGGELVANHLSVTAPVSGSSSPIFRQSGGSLTAGLVDVGSGGRLEYTGGTLDISGLNLEGTLDFVASSANLALDSGVFDFSAGTLANSASASISVAPGVLVIVQPGYDLAAHLSSFTSSGIVHEAGTTLVVPAGQWLAAEWTLVDPVECHGAIAAPSGCALNISNTLTVTDNASVNLGLGKLLTRNGTSGIDSGTLTAGTITVGEQNMDYGSFLQTGGTVNTDVLWVSTPLVGSRGSYTLSDGVLSVGSLLGGENATFIQDGGSVQVARDLQVATNRGSYTISGDASTLHVNGDLWAQGYPGLVLNGGTVTIDGTLQKGRVHLNGGQLQAGTELVSSLFEFYQNGGTNVTPSMTIAGEYYLSDGILNVDHYGTNPGSFFQTGGTHTVNGPINMGYYKLSPGATLSATDATFGTFDYTGGTLNLSGTLTTSACNLGALELAAQTGVVKGSFTNAGGTHALADVLYVAGNYRLEGGVTSARSEYVGYAPSGTLPAQATFTHVGGTNLVGEGLLVGHAGAACKAVYTLSGSGVLNVGTTLNIGSDMDPTAFGRFEWLGGSLQAQQLILGPQGTLAFGRDFSVADLLSGALYSSSSSVPFTINSGSLEVIAGAHGVHDSELLPLKDLKLGYSLGDGSYELSGTGQLSASSEHIGNQSTGSFAQHGGTNTIAQNLYLTYEFSNSSGSYDLTDGALSANYEYVGRYGSGTFTQSGGTNAVTKDLILGYAATGTGSYALSGTGALSAQNEYVGQEGTGTFIQSGGTNTVTNELHVNGSSYELSGTAVLSSKLERLDGSRGATFTQSGGSNTTSSLQLVGAGNGIPTSVYIQTGGTNTVTSNLFLGNATEYQLSGTASLTAKSEGLDGNQTTVFNQTGGTNTVTGKLDVAYDSQYFGTYNLGPDGTLSVANETVGYSGTGVFNQTGGAHMISGSLTLADYSTASSGTYNLSGLGQLAIGGTLRVGKAGTGTFNQSDGTVSALGVEIGTKGSYRISAGSLAVSRGITGTGSIDFQDQAATLSMPVSGILDLSSGRVINTSGAALVGGPSSLVIYDPTQPPDTAFNSFSTTGFVLAAGSSVTVPEGRSIIGWGTIPGHVDLEGSINGGGDGVLSVDGGLFVSGAGFANLAGGTLKVDDLTSGMSGGQLTCMNEYIGNAGNGRFVQSGGDHSVEYTLTVGSSAGSSGTFELDGGQLSCEREYVGYSGNGHFTQTDGDHSVHYTLNLGYAAGSSGTFELAGGQFSADTLVVGRSGAGSFVQTGGSLHTDFRTYVALSSGSQGHYTLSGTGTLTPSGLYVGYGGEGTFTHSAGTLALSTPLYLAYTSTGHGEYDLSGTGSLSTPTLYVGYAAAASFTQTGGQNASTTLYLASQAGSSGTYLQSSGSNQFGTAYLGYNSGSQGTYLQTGGTASGLLYLGYNSGSAGSYELSDTAALTSSSQYVGRSGSGSFSQSGGTNTVNSSLFLGYNAAGAGTYSISAGSLEVGTLYVGNNGTGTFTIAAPAAQVTVSSLLRFGAKGSLSAAPNSTIHMTGTNFENLSTSESNLAGLSNLTLIYDNQSPGTTDTFEIAGTDMGRDPLGFTDNFALAGIELNDQAVLQLMDSVNNGNRNGVGGASEALYVDKLTLEAGSGLNLNGLHLYVCDLEDRGGTIGNGELISMCPGDADGNWRVDSADLATWQRNYDPLGTTRTFDQGDWDGNGRIDSADLAIWQRSYHPLYMGPASLGSPEVTPEPGTMLLLGTGLLTLAGLRRRRLMN